MIGGRWSAGLVSLSFLFLLGVRHGRYSLVGGIADRLDDILYSFPYFVGLRDYLRLGKRGIVVAVVEEKGGNFYYHVRTGVKYKF